MRKILSLLTMLLLCSAIAWSQTKTVTGRVTDESGGPVPFATVKVKGSDAGIAADQNGNFSITVGAGAVLTVSAAGFEEQEVRVGNQSILSISFI